MPSFLLRSYHAAGLVARQMECLGQRKMIIQLKADWSSLELHRNSFRCRDMSMRICSKGTVTHGMPQRQENLCQRPVRWWPLGTGPSTPGISGGDGAIPELLCAMRTLESEHVQFGEMESSASKIRRRVIGREKLVEWCDFIGSLSKKRGV